MTPSAACIAPGVRGACGSRSLAHVTQFTKGAAASLARISARSERRYAGDQLGWCNSGFSREARSVHPRQDCERYFHEVEGKHNEQIAQHMRAVHHAYTLNFVILSDEVIRIFEDFYRRDSYDNLSPPEEHDQFALAIRSLRPKLLQQARSE